MALDQIPKAFRWLRGKIMHNIAILFVKLGQFSDAATTFEFVMQEYPSFQSGFHLSLCYYILMDQERLRNNIQRMISLPIEEDNATAIQHDNHITLMDVAETDDLSCFIQDNKKKSEYSMLMSFKLLADIDQDGSAFSWCIEVIKGSPYYSLADELEINRAVTLLQIGNISQSTDILVGLTKKDLKVAAIATTNLAGIMWLKGEVDTAKDYIVTAIDRGCIYPGLFVNLGNCYFSNGDYETARGLYEKALDMDNICVEAAYNLGLVFKRINAYQDSTDYFQKILTVLRGQFDVMFQLADIYEATGDTDMASDLYIQLLSVLPSEPRVLLRLGHIYDKQKDKKQALYYFSEAHRYSPSSTEAIEWLSSYYIEVQLPEKALPILELATLAQPFDPRWLLLVASVHKKCGSLMKAYEVYKAAHIKFPDNIEILQCQIRLTSDLGFPEAKEYSEILHQIEQARSRTAQRLLDRTGSSSSRISSSGNSDELRFSSPQQRNVETLSRWDSPRPESVRQKQLVFQTWMTSIYLIICYLNSL